MSDHLPENVSDWPGDPFALLGISYDTEPRAARRAYTALIRRFKPEHAPVEFQKIREAYDAVLPLLERRAASGLARRAEEPAAREATPRPSANGEAAAAAEPAGAEPAGAEPGGAEPGGAETGGAEQAAEEQASGAPAAGDGPRPAPPEEPADPAAQLQASYERHARPHPEWTEEGLLTDAALDLEPRYQSKLDKRDFKNLANRRGDAKPLRARRPRPARGRPEWRKAVEGDAAAAYQALCAQWERRPEEEHYLQLYWLLRLHPELDTRREPCDWLTLGLAEFHLAGPLSELYRREIARRPEEALTPRAGRLLTRPAEAGAVVDFCEWRWRAAAQLQRLEVIPADLETLRGGRAYDDQAAWGRLLLLAIDQLAWANEAPLREKVEQFTAEVESLPHLHEELSHGLDRLDLLLELREAWPRLRDAGVVPGQWLRLIPELWRRPAEELRLPLLELAERVAQSPSRGLKNFDTLAELSPAAASQLGQAFMALDRDLALFEGPGWRGQLLFDIVRRFVQMHYGDSYSLLREKLLKFCITESIAPEEVASVLEEDTLHWVGESRSLPDLIRRDAPLAFTYHACRAAHG